MRTHKGISCPTRAWRHTALLRADLISTSLAMFLSVAAPAASAQSQSPASPTSIDSPSCFVTPWITPGIDPADRAAVRDALTEARTAAARSLCVGARSPSLPAGAVTENFAESFFTRFAVGATKFSPINETIIFTPIWFPFFDRYVVTLQAMTLSGQWLAATFRVLARSSLVASDRKPARGGVQTDRPGAKTLFAKAKRNERHGQ